MEIGWSKKLSYSGVFLSSALERLEAMTEIKVQPKKTDSFKRFKNR